MNYATHYDTLITRAQQRRIPLTGPTERHHIVPVSMGGSDDAANMVQLTVQEHYLAHLLLWKAGALDQIFSVECILLNTVNRHRPLRFKHPKLRWKRWIRKAVAQRRAALYRARMAAAYAAAQQKLIAAPA